MTGASTPREKWRRVFSALPPGELDNDDLLWLGMPLEAEDEFRHSGRAPGSGRRPARG